MRHLLKTALLLAFTISSDSIYYNKPNNYGTLGVINTPSARFYDSPAGQISYYNGYSDKRLALSLYPYDWLEATIFYASFDGIDYYNQDYKDKGFSFKIRLKEEGDYPAIAIGAIDIGGTGIYSSEYIVSSYNIGNFDINLGLGWGHLNGLDNLENPFTFFSDTFEVRNDLVGEGGDVNFKNLFSGKKASIFGGINYSLNERILIKLELDPVKNIPRLNYPKKKNDFSFGIDYLFNKNFLIGLNYERGNIFTFNISSRNSFGLQKTEYVKVRNKKADKYKDLINRLGANSIGVTKIEKSNDKVYIDISQFKHHNFLDLEYFVDKSIQDSNLTEEVIKTYKVAGLEVINPKITKEDTETLYQRQFRGLRQSTSLNIRPFIASREEFLKYSLLIENNAELILSDNLFFSTNIKLSLYDNFNDLYLPPETTFPAQVRSDIKDYLKNIGDKPSIGRAQLEYFATLSEFNHILISGGIYEDMFSGYGIEYLRFNPSKNFSWGLKHHAFKRGYDFDFELSGYDNITYHLNLFYINKDIIPMDIKLSYGEYLAGDIGATIEFKRVFNGGVEIGAFASFTDVSSNEFGEGSFDKGIYFKIPLWNDGRLFNFIWRPLTKDPASKLIRKNDLYSLTKRYSLIN